MKHKVYKNYTTALPSWQTILEDLELNLIDGSEVKHLDNLGFVTHRGERIPSVDILRRTIHALHPDKSECTAHIYISLLTSSRTFGRHKDDTDVFFIQALGMTKWVIEENGEHEYILSPGDMIFIPKEHWHNPTPLSPRVGISIGFN
jgi:mannose-6-phosphate isomerase-like protein (cupin superfamily)